MTYYELADSWLVRLHLGKEVDSSHKQEIHEQNKIIIIRINEHPLVSIHQFSVMPPMPSSMWASGHSWIIFHRRCPNCGLWHTHSANDSFVVSPICEEYWNGIGRIETIAKKEISHQKRFQQEFWNLVCAEAARKMEL
ncbi:MAG: hypothetical protein UT24_C0011G0042 [Candidatus Woesebacteria bacterium GW2011_GWB1_39_12]|uniref:Uncharacterized protein n=1 Tax=Candidatus Woesebacteria bacterium GW2011_GWB1_39_12 TaxID=1618574 RepID=A0A0G0M914_9BACT|nr:MAG: hypothetical protein UT24_C0011G0042 [Candidatus Woesebacteria bacterium GW2011_GWB1_39_12]